jgi:hypothetical protein
LILFTIEGEISRVATQRNAVKGRATLAVPHPISWEAVVRLARRGAGQRKDVGRERLLRSPGGSVAVEGIRHCGREEAVWSRSCSCRHSEASRRGPGEREEVGDAKPEEGRDAGEVHTGTVPRRGQFVAEKETFFSRLSALAVAREPRLGVTWVLAPSNVFRLSSRAGRSGGRAPGIKRICTAGWRGGCKRRRSAG